MEEKNNKQSADQVVKEIKRRTRRTFTAEEKIKIVLEPMRGEYTIATICRKYAIYSNNYFNGARSLSKPVNEG
jgi:transposase